MYRFMRSVRAPWMNCAGFCGFCLYSQLALPAIIVHQMPMYIFGVIQLVSGLLGPPGRTLSSRSSFSSGISDDSTRSPGLDPIWNVRHGVTCGASTDAFDPSGSGASSAEKSVDPSESAASDIVA